MSFCEYIQFPNVDLHHSCYSSGTLEVQQFFSIAILFLSPEIFT